jgi:MFS family permease
MTGRAGAVEPGADPVAPDLPPLRKNLNFVRLWISAGISRLGTSVTMTAYPLLVLWHTGSASATGLVAFAASLPNLLVQLPAGAVVDRWDRRKLMIGCDLAGFFTAASVAVAESISWFWLPYLAFAAFIQAALVLVYQLAERASVRHVVPAKQLPAALAQNEARGAAIGLLGQPASGVLFTLARWLPFLVNAVGNVVAVGLMLLIRIGFQTGSPGPRQPLHVDITEGVRWLWRNRYLRVMISVFAGSNVVFRILLLAVMVTVHSGGRSPALVGIVLGIAGVGGVLGAWVASWWSRRLTFQRVVTVGFAVWTVLTPMAVSTTDPLMLTVTLSVISFIASLFNVLSSIYQMRVTPNEIQGRVSGAIGFLTSGASALGALIGGYLLDHIGSVHTANAVGVFVLILTLATAWPGIRKDAPEPDGADIAQV